MTKAQLTERFEQYMNSTAYDLWDVYGTFSKRKISVYDEWRGRMLDKHGYGMRIISHNSQVFTLGFLRNILDADNSIIQTIFTFVTPAHVYELDVTDLI